MLKLLNAWRFYTRWFHPEPDKLAGSSSGKAYVREWHRRQRQALHEAIKRQTDGERRDK